MAAGWQHRLRGLVFMSSLVCRCHRWKNPVWWRARSRPELVTAHRLCNQKLITVCHSFASAYSQGWLAYTTGQWRPGHSRQYTETAGNPAAGCSFIARPAILTAIEPAIYEWWVSLQKSHHQNIKSSSPEFTREQRDFYLQKNKNIQKTNKQKNPEMSLTTAGCWVSYLLS